MTIEQKYEEYLVQFTEQNVSDDMKDIKEAAFIGASIDTLLPFVKSINLPPSTLISLIISLIKTIELNSDISVEAIVGLLHGLVSGDIETISIKVEKEDTDAKVSFH